MRSSPTEHCAWLPPTLSCEQGTTQTVYIKPASATRRLRSDLRTLRPVLDQRWSEPLRDELRWIGHILGQARDADVLAGLLAEHAELLRPGHHARAMAFIRQIEQERDHEREILLEAMNSPRYLALLDRLVDGSHEPRLQDGGRIRSTPAASVAARLIGKPWTRLRSRVQHLPANPPDRDLHEVRKRAEQARYALEAFAPVTGKQAARAAKRLATLQDTLGDHHDAVVAMDWIEHAARQPEDLETSFVVGELVETFEIDRRQLRDAWVHDWKRSRRGYRNRTW